MTEPDGCLHTPMTTLRTMLSTVAAWQTWCNVPDAAAALLRIHRMVVEITGGETGDDAVPFPFAVVGMGDRWESEAVAQGATADMYVETGSVFLAFEDVLAQEETDRDGLTRFVNNVSAVLDGLRAISGQGANLNIVRIMQRDPPGLFAEAKHKTRPARGVQAAYLIEWGP